MLKLKQNGSKQRQNVPEIQPRDKLSNIPPSFAQQRLWFIDQLGEGSLQYNSQGQHLMQGNFQVNAFQQALKTLLDRHEVLRTHFKSVAGEAQQVIVKDYDLPFTQHDFSQLSVQDKAVQVRRVMRDETAIPFNLSRDLMVRVCLLKLSNTHHLLLYTMHHIASDGWSIGIFKRELNLLYKAYSEKQDNPLAPLKVQYADYALWQHNWLQGEVLEKQLGY